MSKDFLTQNNVTMSNEIKMNKNHQSVYLSNVSVLNYNPFKLMTTIFFLNNDVCKITIRIYRLDFDELKVLWDIAVFFTRCDR